MFFHLYRLACGTAVKSVRISISVCVCHVSCSFFHVNGALSVTVDHDPKKNGTSNTLSESNIMPYLAAGLANDDKVR